MIDWDSSFIVSCFHILSEALPSKEPPIGVAQALSSASSVVGILFVDNPDTFVPLRPFQMVALFFNGIVRFSFLF